MARTGGRKAVPDDVKAQLGERLRLLRERLGLKQHEVATAGGFPREYMSKFESGANLSSATQTIALAKAFDVPVELFSLYMTGEMDLEDFLDHRKTNRQQARPLSFGDDRYRAMPAVRLMATTQGMPQDFIESFEVALDLDYDPSADDLWTICKGEYAKWKGKRVTAGDPLADLERVRPASKKR